MAKPLHVAVAVIKDTADRLLISLRPEGVHQGNLWEFPGGKLDKAETVTEALKRELHEELGITLECCMPLIKIRHAYDDLEVLLDVWTVTRFSGTASGREGQSIRWVQLDELSDYQFPAANYPIISAVTLPSDYAILDSDDTDNLLPNLRQVLDKGITLLQLRLKQNSPEQISTFLQQALPLIREKKVKLLINSAVPDLAEFEFDGLHLTALDLLACDRRPENYQWVAASCHTQAELQHAERIGVDFVVLAPVKATATHPGKPGIGWDNFQKLCTQVNLPVYALGGLDSEDKMTAQRAGAQGIAGISAYCQARDHV